MRNSTALHCAVLYTCTTILSKIRPRILAVTSDKIQDLFQGLKKRLKVDTTSENIHNATSTNLKVDDDDGSLQRYDVNHNVLFDSFVMVHPHQHKWLLSRIRRRSDFQYTSGQPPPVRLPSSFSTSTTA